MTRKESRCNRVTFLIIIFLIIFSGCATKEAIKGVSDEEALRERVMAYWNHKTKEEFDKSYGYEDPLFRKRVSMVQYIKSFNTERAVWTDAATENLKMEGESAIVDMKVKVKIFVTPSKNIEQDVLFKEKWVKVDGMWYHVPQKSGERRSVD
ncbi:MAG: hypothetical protein ABR903_09450 [Thermodesulfovibrionales bacterium]